MWTVKNYWVKLLRKDIQAWHDTMIRIYALMQGYDYHCICLVF
jgi:hypothetical protein